MDLRLAAMTVAILTELMSIALADHAKDKLPEPAWDKAQPVAQRVILPASWEPNNEQTATRSTK